MRDSQLRPAQARIDEKLRRIVAGFAVDFDGPGEIGGTGIVQPIVIGEPTARVGHDEKISAARVPQTPRRLGICVQDLRHARLVFEDGAHLVPDRRVIDVDVRDLMVRDGERPARPGIENLRAEFVAPGDPAPFPEHAVEVHGTVHGGDAVFRQHGDLHALCLKRRDQIGGHFVDGAQVRRNRRIVRAEPLEVVVEVRQVNEMEVGRVAFLQPASGGSDPPRRRDARARSPERRERELTEVPLDLRPQRSRLAGDVEDLRAVRPVDRPRA